MSDFEPPQGDALRTRFAPSPTGLLHLGHARSALDGWTRARAAGGRFLLRLEDIDQARCRPEYAQATLEDLAWIGLDWDGPVRVQSAHLAQYRQALDALDANGLLYPCFCTRGDIAASASAQHPEPGGTPGRAPDGTTVYPGTCRRLAPAERAARLASGEVHAQRLDMARAVRVAGPLTRLELGQGHAAGRIACHPELFGDVVLARKDVPASYHLCVTHDDALQGVTLVTRGIDLLPSTDLHRLLQALMHWPEPAYAHHSLLHDLNGKRLSKRDGAASLASLRAQGISPDEIRTMAGKA